MDLPLQVKSCLMEDTTIQAVLLDISGSTEGPVLQKLIREVYQACLLSSRVLLVTFSTIAEYKGAFVHPADLLTSLQELKGNGRTYTDRAVEMLWEQVKKDPWLDVGRSPFYNVLIATDGQMNRSCQENFSLALKNLSQWLMQIRHLQLRLFLLTVEDLDMNEINVRASQKMAGGDIMMILVEKGQKSLVSRFISYLPELDDSGHVHFEFFIPRDFKNEIAYDSKTVFPISKLSWFVSNFLYHQIIQAKQCKDEVKQNVAMLRILQQTSWVLKMAKESLQPLTFLNGICQLVHYEYPSFGQGEIYSILLELMDQDVFYLVNIKEKRRLLYNNATNELKRNTRRCTGMSFGISLPCGFLGEDIIYVVPYSAVNQPFTIANKNEIYMYAATKWKDVLLPMLPGSLEKDFTSFDSQCARQACRLIAVHFNAKMQHAQVNESSYILLPYYLLLNLRVAKSNAITSRVKQMYKNLALNMLYMKRTNDIEKTEMDSLLEGNLLRCPHDGLTSKIIFSSSVASHLFLGHLLQSARYYADIPHNLALRPLTWWWAMIVALDDVELLQAQWPNVCESVSADLHVPCGLVCTDLSKFPLLEQMKTIEGLSIPYEYYCPISLEDTSEKGGFILRPHGECFPSSVFQFAFPLEDCGCPYCHMPLIPERDYIPIGPKSLQPTNTNLPDVILPKALVHLPPLQQLIWESNLIPTPGQGAIVDVSYFCSAMEPLQMVVFLASFLRVDPLALKNFFIHYDCVFVYGSVLLRLMKKLPMTDIDIVFIGPNPIVLAAMHTLRYLLDSSGMVREYIHTSTGVFTAYVLDGALPPVQFVRAEEATGYKDADDIIHRADNPIVQCCLFSKDQTIQLRASVHLLDFLECNLVKWWNLSCPLLFARALRYKKEYGFHFSLELSQEMENHPFLTKIRNSTQAPQDTCPLRIPFDAANTNEKELLQLQVESWLHGVTAKGDHYPAKEF